MDKSLFPLILFSTARSWRNQMDKRLKPLGLSQAKWRALIQLSLSDQAISQTDLAERLCIEKASLVGLIDRLVKGGWVVRKPDPLDRRGRKIHLTSKALNTLQIIHQTADELRQEILSAIPQNKLEECIYLLQQIKNQLDHLR